MKSGDGAAEFTEKDEWILSKFSFLRAHIYDVKKRTTVNVSKINIVFLSVLICTSIV